METIICPHCRTENPINAQACSYCKFDLRPPAREPAFIGINAAAQKDANSQQLGLLPETPSDSTPGAQTRPDGQLRPEGYIDGGYRNPIEAAGAYAEAFLSKQMNGKPVILRENARKKIICALILAVVLFLSMSLRMLYHRNKFIFFLIAAACVFCAVRFVFMNTNAKALGKKLASMPETDMESILMSEADQCIDMRRIRVICGGILAAAVAAVVILFWTPHMIFEKTDGIVSLRFYTDSIIKEKDVVIPDEWNGEAITQIRGNVFEGITWIETVKLPGNLKTIRAHAFQGCSNLREVVFPATLEEIGSSAFRKCRSLGSVTLPSKCYVNGKAFKESPTKINRFDEE